MIIFKAGIEEPYFVNDRLYVPEYMTGLELYCWCRYTPSQLNNILKTSLWLTDEEKAVIPAVGQNTLKDEKVGHRADTCRLEEESDYNT